MDPHNIPPRFCHCGECDAHAIECHGSGDGRSSLDRITELSMLPTIEARRDRRPLNFNRPTTIPLS